MQLHRSPRGLVVAAPAKLNLFFEVLGKRDDGYHEIETLVVPISLYDTLVFVEGDAEQIEFTCRRALISVPGSGTSPLAEPLGTNLTGEDDLPSGSTNLVVRAVELLRREARVPAEAGVRIHLVKRIPTAAGLGGGSSDAAAALAAANVLWRLGWSNEALAELGAQLGSDVPLFFVPGPALCRGRGERVESAPGLGTLHFVVVRPPVGLATAAVYKVCRPAATPRHVEPLLAALGRGELGEAGRRLHNQLQEAAQTLSPWIHRLHEEFAHMDCWGHQMSGSGSCYFGLCRHARHARRVAEHFRARGLGMAWAVRSSP